MRVTRRPATFVTRVALALLVALVAVLPATVAGAAQPVTSLSGSVSPSIASSTEAAYTIDFTTSSQGALTVGASTITISLPNTGGCVGSYTGDGQVTVTDLSTHVSGQVQCGAFPGTFGTPIPIGPGDQVQITTPADYTAPPNTGPETFSVATSKDAQTTATLTVAHAAQALTNVTGTVSPSIASSTEAAYTIDFTTSSQGALTVGASTITISLPNTGGCVGSYTGDGQVTVTDLSTHVSGQVQCGAFPGTFGTPIPIGPGDQVQITTPADYTAPPNTGPETFSVATSKDAQTTATLTVAHAAQALTNVTGTVSPSIASSTEAAYTIDFTTSSQGALTVGASTITISLPNTGGCVGSYTGDGQVTVTDLSTHVSGQVQCGAFPGTFGTPIPIGPGDQVQITTPADYTAPPNTGPETFSVATSKDAQTTATLTVAHAAQALTNVTGTVSSAAPSGLAAYTVDFTSSLQGALAVGVSSITVSLAGLGGCNGSYTGNGQVTVTDLSTHVSGQISCGQFPGTFGTPIAIGPGDQVQITTPADYSPLLSVPETFSVATSKDGETFGTAGPPVTTTATTTTATTTTTTTSATASSTSTTSTTLPVTTATGASADTNPAGATTTTSSPTARGGVSAAQASVAAPVVGVRQTVAPVSGVVLVRPRGSAGFVPLTMLGSLPNGSEIDATNGTGTVTVAAGGGHTQSAEATGGRFVLEQGRSAGGPTRLVLSLPLSGCPAVPLPSGSAASVEARGAAKARSGPVTRHLWVSETGGHWGTNGRFVSTSVEGTRWLTTDVCTSSSVEVASGKVRVRDLVRGTTTVITAGRRYTATSRRR